MKNLILLLLLPLPGLCQTGIEILQSSAAKIKTVKNISYNIYEENHDEKITADVIIERKNDLPILDARIKVSGIAIGNSGSKNVNFSYDGQSFDFIDLKTNTIHAEHGGNRENFKEDIIEKINKSLKLYN